jgi:hypothetical protein
MSAQGRLSVHEREDILLGLHRGLSLRAIARALSRARELSHLASASASSRLLKATEARQVR